MSNRQRTGMRVIMAVLAGLACIAVAAALAVPTVRRGLIARFADGDPPAPASSPGGTGGPGSAGGQVDPSAVYGVLPTRWGEVPENAPSITERPTKVGAIVVGLNYDPPSGTYAHLAVLADDGSGYRRIRSAIKADEASLSPDGQYLFWSAWHSESSNDVHLLRLIDGRETVVPFTTLDDTFWERDGTALYLIGARPDTGVGREVYRLDLIGGQLTVALTGAAAQGVVDRTTGGKWLVRTGGPDRPDALGLPPRRPGAPPGPDPLVVAAPDGHGWASGYIPASDGGATLVVDNNGERQVTPSIATVHGITWQHWWTTGLIGTSEAYPEAPNSGPAPGLERIVLWMDPLTGSAKVLARGPENTEPLDVAVNLIR